MLPVKSALNSLHAKAVFERRVRVLASQLARVIPRCGSVLDFGCGDGSIAVALMAQRPDLTVEGVDVLVRPTTRIPVTGFDGRNLPFGDGAFDFVTIVDVLHHTDDPRTTLAEASRVARQGLAVKDHVLDGLLAGPTLRLMDWFGNRGHDVVLPYNYFDRWDWADSVHNAGLTESHRNEHLALYPPPLTWVFDRRLHFVSYLAQPTES